MKFTYESIGIVHSPHQNASDMPIQPCGAKGVVGTIELAPELEEGLKDLEGFSHIIVLYHFHRAGVARLSVTPFLDDRPHGVFATRSPCRPNPVGLSVVRLVKVSKTSLQVEDVDILDGTPVLDIKPYVPEFDAPEVERAGWLTKSAGAVRGRRSDGRFERDAT